MHVFLFSTGVFVMRVQLGTSPPRGTVGCATFPFRVSFRLSVSPPRHDGGLQGGVDVGFLCHNACVLLQFAFLRLTPPRHAAGSREVFDGGLPYHSAFLRLAPPPRWRYAGDLHDGLPYYSVCVSLKYFYSRFSWLHSQAVQRCGGGF